MINFKCPHCEKSFSVKDELAGKKAKCPKCESRIVVPLPDVVRPLPIAKPVIQPSRPNPLQAERVPEIKPEVSEPKKPEGFFGRLLKGTKCDLCAVNLSMVEIAAKLQRCMRCAIQKSGLLKNAQEEILFSQGASYCDGLPDRAEAAKTPGYIYVAADHLYYLDTSMSWSVEWEHVRSLDLHNFQMSGVRAVLAGMRAIMMQNVKNTLAITYVDSERNEWIVKIQIHGALTIPGEQQKAIEVVAHTNRFKPRFFRPEKTSNAKPPPTDVLAALEKLAKLKEQDVLSQEEFDEYKKVLLARVS